MAPDVIHVELKIYIDSNFCLLQFEGYDRISYIFNHVENLFQVVIFLKPSHYDCSTSVKMFYLTKEINELLLDNKFTQISFSKKQ